MMSKQNYPLHSYKCSAVKMNKAMNKKANTGLKHRTCAFCSALIWKLMPQIDRQRSNEPIGRVTKIVHFK